jgi:calcium/calmodulin-dependent protein kinase (CaM kinase) II
MTESPIMNELIQLTERLLQSIATSDWETYEQLCDPTLSAFEPEACGHLIEGMDFHRFYFELGGSGNPQQTTLVQPHVRMLGEDVAIVSYNRLVQSVGKGGDPVSSCSEETRVWQKQEGAWKHVHFHRSRS